MDFDKRSAYEILGLKNDANKDQIIRKYDTYFKRYRAYLKDNSIELDFDMEEINAAYNHLMGYDIEFENESTNRKRPILEMLKIDPTKFDTFWYYNRTKIIVSIIVLIIVATTVYQAITNVPYDFNVKFIGAYASDSEVVEQIELRLNEELVNVENSFIDTGFGSTDNPEMEMAAVQKLAAQMAAGELDIFICDFESYKGYAISGFFESIEPYVSKEVLEANKDLYINYKDPEYGDEVKGYYGVRIENLDIFEGIISLKGDDQFIFCLSVKPGNEPAQKEYFEKYILPILE